MNNGKKYKVVIVNANGEMAKDNKVFKTLEGALKRLSSLVISEELCLRAGFGAEHQYHVQAC